ncbi:hypothetical protein HNQ39_000287 [Armatimonas rosea]|jgi:hypothetical protein|uniref:Uncharacterized protein n=1 Tax=Armatimonas rosea TaxID=685828 RepID=A0A7W9W547_ARMRO|nr:hypothetical protein [Armatimonas rosea]
MGIGILIYTTAAVLFYAYLLATARPETKTE